MKFAELLESAIESYSVWSMRFIDFDQRIFIIPSLSGICRCKGEALGAFKFQEGQCRPCFDEQRLNPAEIGTVGDGEQHKYFDVQHNTRLTPKQSFKPLKVVFPVRKNHLQRGCPIDVLLRGQRKISRRME